MIVLNVWPTILRSMPADEASDLKVAYTSWFVAVPLA